MWKSVWEEPIVSTLARYFLSLFGMAVAKKVFFTIYSTSCYSTSIRDLNINDFSHLNRLYGVT